VKHDTLLMRDFYMAGLKKTPRTQVGDDVPSRVEG
jgi:hypothetical protein